MGKTIEKTKTYQLIQRSVERIRNLSRPSWNNWGRNSREKNNQEWVCQRWHRKKPTQEFIFHE
jgi:hypothetical protein